jgi:hypothetical protein
MMRGGSIALGGVAVALALVACGGSNAVDDELEGKRELSIAVCAPDAGGFTLEITNPFMPYGTVGSQWILEGDEGSTAVRLQITVLDETEEVAGVTTRVVEEREWEDDELIEVSRNFLVQASDGSVCYFGEDVADYEDGEVVSSGGEWRAGVDGAEPGILMPANPEIGTWHRQEVAEGVAEDGSSIVALGETVSVPAGEFTDTLTVHDVNPLDDEVETKHYARNVGLIVDADLELLEYTP